MLVGEALILEPRVKPADCRSMVELRAAIDSLDRSIVLLLKERQSYMDVAVTLQHSHAAVGDKNRIQAVYDNVKSAARACGLFESTAEAVWAALIERATRYETSLWEAKAEPASD